MMGVMVPWMSPPMVDWHGKWLLRMINAKVLSAMIAGVKTVEILTVKEWISWGVQGCIIAAIRQGITPNDELEAKIPAAYQQLQVNEANNGKIIGLAIISEGMGIPISVEEHKLGDQNKPWIQAFASSSRSVHRFKWLCLFDEPIEPIAVNDKPRGGMMTLADADQIQVVEALCRHILEKDPMNRFDGPLAVSATGSAPILEGVRRLQVDLETEIKKLNSKTISRSSWEPSFPARYALFQSVSDAPSPIFVLRLKDGKTVEIKALKLKHDCRGRMTAVDLAKKILESKAKTLDVWAEINNGRRLETLSSTLETHETGEEDIEWNPSLWPGTEVSLKLDGGLKVLAYDFHIPRDAIDELRV
jgi:hypothetical protein